MSIHQDKAIELVVEYYNSAKPVETTRGFLLHSDISTDDVYVVWFAKTLANFKALLGTTRPDGMYFEVTYDGDKDVAYLDAYSKYENNMITNVFGK